MTNNLLNNVFSNVKDVASENRTLNTRSIFKTGSKSLQDFVNLPTIVSRPEPKVNLVESLKSNELVVKKLTDERDNLKRENENLQKELDEAKKNNTDLANFLKLLKQKYPRLF